MTFRGEAALELRRDSPGSGDGGNGDGAGPGLERFGAGTFAAIAVVSIGGPLALAALYAPALVDDVPASAGLVSVIGAAVFALPLLIWLRYSKEIASSGGLFAFVEAAAGRRVALVQAAIWTLSYLLYLTYTTEYVVYDILPATLPGIRPYRPLLEIVIPMALAAIVLGGRKVTAVAICALAVGQLGLTGLLAVTSIGHAHPGSSFTTIADAGGVAAASGNTALLFVCSSLPLFFGGEVRRPRTTVRRGITAAYALTAIAIVASVFPLASNPAFAHAEIPGMSMVSVFVGHGAGVAIGVGVASSVIGVMLVEYLAVTRLMHAVRGTSLQAASRLVAIPLVLAGPISLINPDRFYDDLLKPSLVALWLSQLVVVAVFPRFMRARLRNPTQRWSLAVPTTLALAAGAVVLFGLYSTLRNQVAT